MGLVYQSNGCSKYIHVRQKVCVEIVYEWCRAIPMGVEWLQMAYVQSRCTKLASRFKKGTSIQLAAKFVVFGVFGICGILCISGIWYFKHLVIGVFGI